VAQKTKHRIVKGIAITGIEVCVLLRGKAQVIGKTWNVNRFFVGRSCLALAQTYSQLPRDLFNAAFVSCWTELSEQYQNELILALKQALMVPDLPEITQTILNLAEFMEHCDKVR